MMETDVRRRVCAGAWCLQRAVWDGLGSVIVLTGTPALEKHPGISGVSEGLDVQGQVSDHSPSDSGLAVTVDFLLTDGKSWHMMWAG